MPRAIKFAAAIGLAVAGLAGWAFIAAPKELRFGAEVAPHQQGLGLLLAGYLVTVAGVALGSAYRSLEALRAGGMIKIPSVPAFLSDVFHSVDLWAGLFGSPIVYALIWRALDGGGAAALFIVALQNGFCCTIVLGSLRPSPTQPQPAEEAGRT